MIDICLIVLSKIVFPKLPIILVLYFFENFWLRILQVDDLPSVPVTPMIFCEDISKFKKSKSIKILFLYLYKKYFFSILIDGDTIK